MTEAQNTKRPGALIAMSGGVDSSVAAWLMQQAGYDCTGITMRLTRNETLGQSGFHTCCSEKDIEDAAEVAFAMDIPYEVLDFTADFREKIIEKFIRVYEMGGTPNPCIDCNRYMKFDHLLRWAESHGMEYVVTGHYARVEQDEATGRWLLKKGLDEGKDQSYVLYNLTQEQLAHVRLPLGGLHKAEVREIAEKQHFINARKHDSQDICFVPDGDYARFMEDFTGKHYPAGDFLDENGKMCADTTIRSKINAEQSAIAAMEEVCGKVGLKDSKELAYLIGTGYGRNKVPFADENISEISCHAMGVHVTNPEVRAIIDIGGQDVKGISIDTDGTVKSFAMNDKCSAGTGRFFEAMARSFEMSLPEFSNLSLSAKNVIPITAQCTVFAESEVITLVGEGKPTDEIAAGIEMAVAKRCFVMAKKAGATDSITLTGGCAKNAGLKQAIERVLKLKVIDLKTDPQLMGALGAAEYARQKGMAR